MATKKITLPFGIAGHNLGEIEREVPLSEPPAWPVNDALRHVGKRVRRTDAEAKVTGEARYTADMRLPGMLYARMLRSDAPHARILSIDTGKAEAHPGVHAVHVIRHLQAGAQADGEREGSFPMVRFAGQPVAAVAAESLDIAAEALRLIDVQYEYLDFVVDLEKAREPGAPLVFKTEVQQKEDSGDVGVDHSGLEGRGNVRGPSTSSFYGGDRGSLEQGFAEADFILERTYRTQVQTHAPLETHGVVVDWKPNTVTVYASTQSTKNVRDEIAEFFDLPKSRVRVISEFTGGGFGAKHSAGDFGPMAAILSKKSGRPVWLMYDRKEEQVSAGNRPNSIQRLKIGAKKDGTLTAIEQESYGTGGIALGAGVGRVAQAMYACPNFATRQYDVFTHAGPGAAWRAPGNVQGAFAVEQAIDELAENLGMDPLAMRDIIDKSEIRKIERQRGAERFGWSRRKGPGADTGPVKKGIGIAQAIWPRFVHLDSTAEVRIFKDGATEIRSAVQDIGTGTKTVLAQVVAEELGISPEDVTVRIGDTLFPNGPNSGGSVVTGSITPAARNAAYKAKLELFEQVARTLQTDPSKLATADGMIYDREDSTKSISYKDALKKMRTGQIIAAASRSDDYGGFRQEWGLAYGELGSVQFAEVTVDTETGFVRADKIVAAHSCGRPINIAQVESQINGGIIQGVSYALYENRIMDEQTGFMMNANLDQYKICYSMETPDIETIVIEDYAGRSSTDAYGIGEPANIATAAAVANAVYNAIGARIYSLPITPDKILRALKKI